MPNCRIHIFKGLLILLLLPLSLFAQDPITAGEYYYDIDPGIGSAIPFTLSTSGISIDETIELNTTGLPVGVHILHVRLQTSTNTWGHSSSYLVSITESGTSTSTTLLQEGEYFIDTDPGIGLATPFNFTQGANVDELIELDSQNTPSGSHILHIRIKNANGAWGHTTSYSFVVSQSGTSTALSLITEGEYYYDTDPGIGQATSFTFTSSSSNQNELIEFNTDNLSNGMHILHVRTKNENGAWSHTNSQLITVSSTGTSTASTLLTGGEFFMVKDPGIGNAIPFSLDNDSNSFEKQLEFTLDTLPFGIHTLYFRVVNENGAWGHTDFGLFYKKPAERPDGIALDQYEVYFTTDSGMQTGTIFSFPNKKIVQDTVIAIDVPTAGMQITEVQHIGLRFYDDSGYVSVNKGEEFEFCPDRPTPPVGLGGTICENNGTTIALQASGGAEDTYHWWNRVSGLQNTQLTGINGSGPIFNRTLTGIDTFYVSTYNPNAVCKHSSRVPVEAILVPFLNTPTIADANPLICALNEFSMIPSGAPATGSYRWYQKDSLNQDSLIFEGNVLTLDTLTTNKQYRVRAISNAGICEANEPNTLTINVFTRICHPATVTFNPQQTFIFGDSALPLLGYAQVASFNLDTLPVEYEIISGPAQLIGLDLSTVDFTGIGDVVIQASFNGNDSVAKAIPVIDTIRSVASSAGLSLTSNSPSCEGEILQLNASTIVDATYTWTGPNGFTSNLRTPTIVGVRPEHSGWYSVRAETISETFKATDSITVFPRAKQVGILAQQLDSCGQQTFELKTFGGDFSSFRWYLNGSSITRSDTSNFFPFKTGVYMVQAFDSNGCESFAPPVFIDMEPDSVPTISFLTNPDRLKSSPAVTYQWYINNLIVAGGDQQTLPLFINGTYRVKTSNSGGCTLYSNTIVVNRESLADIPLSNFIKNGVVYLPSSNTAYNTINVHPNPSHGQVSITLRATIPDSYQYAITTMSGQDILSGNLFAQTDENYVNTIDISSLNPGVYYVKVVGSELIRTEKILVTK